jgi:hypothetical protein
VCVLRIAGKRAVRQARDRCPASTPDFERSTRLEGWAPFIEGDHPQRRQAPDARERALEWDSARSARAFADLNSLSLGPTCQAFPVDCRSQPRHERLELRPADRDAARQLIEAAAQCGNSLIKLEGWQEGPGDGFDLRAIVQTHCGTRYCERCSAAMRRHQLQRCLGAWGMFTTLTIQAGIHSVREEWDLVYGAGRVFRREVRRESKRRTEQSAARTWRGEYAHIARQALARMRLTGPDKIEYAWALEPHRDGRPHLHMIWNQEWMSFSWVRRIWSAALGMMDARIDGRKVWSTDGVCAYLAKYISKRNMSLDVLAILKGRRTWASTLEAPVSDESKWWPAETGRDEDLALQIEERSEWGADEGWAEVSGKDNSYAIWKRPAEVHAPKIIAEVAVEASAYDSSNFDEVRKEIKVIRIATRYIQERLPSMDGDRVQDKKKVAQAAA